MPLSALMTTILEQAIEPLHCLHGAGYFSEEEWIQLDFIMNKKYVWTTGPKSRFHNAMKAGYNANKFARAETKDSALSISEQGGVRILTSSKGTSSGTSVAPSLDGVGNSTFSVDFGWELSPAMNSPAPVKAIVREKASLPPPTRFQPAPDPSGTLVELDDRVGQNPSLNSQPVVVRNDRKDVNSFETSNAAEWDEEPFKQEKISAPNDMKILLDEGIEEKIEKIENFEIRENHVIKGSIQSSLPQFPPIPASFEDRFVQRTATITRTTRRGNPRVVSEPRDPTYIPPLPKTKTCWFWAESVGGCRYRPEECLNLHVKPKPGMLPNYPLKDGKPTWGCLADATPQEVPEGKKPRSCWYWATKGVCEHGAACRYVHGWVKGGVAPRPKHIVVDSSDEEDSDDSDDDVLDLSGRDVGDKAPSQVVNMTPGFIASRVRALAW